MTGYRRTAPLGLALTVVLGLGAAACDRSQPPVDAGPPRCDVPLAVPDGFEVVGGLEDPHADRIGVRVDLTGDGGQELHYFSGIRGEFGEGLADRGDVRLADGGRGTLLGAGRTWVLTWSSAQPCTPTTVLGSGMTGRAFRALLRSAGALAER